MAYPCNLYVEEYCHPIVLVYMPSTTIRHNKRWDVQLIEYNILDVSKILIFDYRMNDYILLEFEMNH